MSIFRNTFTTVVREQLNARQQSLQRRTKPSDIIYQNSRNSWVRMTSGVNVNGTSVLAKNYILQGGVLPGPPLAGGAVIPPGLISGVGKKF
jgi:hypothetical protein